MKVTRNQGMLLLSIWLILIGLLELVRIPIPFLNVIMSILAIVAGAFILIGK